MKHLYYVRHGESEGNVSGVFSGRSDVGLTANGREQARQAGAAAAGLNIDYIICSPLVRAHETAKIIATELGLPVESIAVDELLLERDFGSMEGLPYVPHYDFSDVADAESYDALFERVTKVWQHIQSLPQENILVVSHGSTGRMLRHVVHPDIPFASKAEGHRFPNAEITQLI